MRYDGGMNDYERVRQQYRPGHIKVLLIAESPPPPPETQSSRQFYWSERVRRDDRLFTNTIRALYPEAAEVSEPELEEHKAKWLRRFAADGFYMIEALEESQVHEVTKEQRQERIAAALPRLVERVRELAGSGTKLILIKSNVYEVAAEPLRAAGFSVPQTELVDYPGRFNQRAYRDKLARLVNPI
jgi:phosphoglycolate phosphatase-like HAD superfamily hydrolase